ncbi:bifunctional DNA primase/polymerase [Lacrimispora sp. 210928-DFI.3.58]|uniref:bifunctional DNA primase/polymerase n=1 Tax=Lacrimispora sp. 210928-DFI.3.58 TaxID=2883214 RepID=UPI001D089724|nr:bifunctional DNA primase/polymerase [Lacrimispora sp. 210928-DFI.3.58]MCB7317150.1 bifunctional DNA primase/polymerase [Lacrimispora sp. 210928-DFI.3.58]
MSGNMKQWAAYYASMGLAVFPIKPRGKQPLTEHGCKDASKVPEQIESWWTRWPSANIGIATGSASGGLVVIDLDVDKDKGIDGRETLREWETQHRALPGHTWLAITGRGGYHYFYRDMSVVKNRTGIYEGIDVRGEGGYIVAPPSIHPNGHAYEWEQAPDEYPLAEANATVFNFLAGSVPEKWERKPLELPEQIPAGQRTETMVKLVCSQQAKGLSDEAIRVAVRAENDAKCVPPLTDQELEREVFPVLKRYKKGTAPYAASYNHRTGSFQPAARKEPISLVSMDTVEEKEPEWLITDYMPKGQITVLAGDGGAGKTTIWCSIAAAVSSGSTCFLNSDNPFTRRHEPGTVIFFSSEDSAEYTLKGKLRRAGADLGRVLSLYLSDERFSEIKFNAPLLEELIREHRPALVVFDPLQSFIPPDIQMGQRNAMRDCLSALIGLGEKYGTTFLIIVHTNKQIGLWGRKRIADSADIWDIARSVLIAGEAEEGLRYISQEKSNYGPQAETVLFSLDSGKVEFKGYTDKKDRDYVLAAQASTHQTPARNDAKAFILDYLKDGERETADLDSMMKAQGISGRTLERAKAELKKDGKIMYKYREFGKEKKVYCKLSDPISC